MKNIILLFIITGIFLLPERSYSQSFSPTVISSAGNQVDVGGLSVSSTLGETFTTTLTSGNLMLTQGFQQPIAITLSTSATAITCNGGLSTVVISASGGSAPYSGAGTFLVSAGTHVYVVTDANGYSNSTTVTLTEPTAVIASATATAIVCNGGTSQVSLTATGGTIPYTGIGTLMEIAGTYSYTITDANGCLASTSVTITEPAKVEGATSSISTSCAGNDGSATVVPTGGIGGYTYLWSNSQTSQTATSLSSGTYSVVITDGNGCTGSASIVVVGGGTFPETPSAITGSAGACRNQAGVVYTVSPVPSATSYLWTLPVGATGSSNTNSITVSYGPTYSGGFICVSAINNCGTSLQSCKNIPVLTTRPSRPTIISGPSIICAGSIGTYSTTSANSLSYTWSVTGIGVYIIDGQGQILFMLIFRLVLVKVQYKFTAQIVMAIVKHVE
ncbi:MAG: SprB repeat-containing protein [Bacteroidetes bacterium]|nr:SprB repeat-containing protein [Bacteroidota bacterium]